MSRGSVLRMLDWSTMSANDRDALLDRDLNKVIAPQLREQIAKLVVDVRERGDAAVCDALARFDGVTVTPEQLLVGPDERERARSAVDQGLQAAIKDMVAHIRRFNEALMERLVDW